MASRAAWHNLPVSHPSLPALLVSVSFAQSSYTIHLTDLANIWTEDVAKKEIVKRSMNEDTSIDVYEDAEQMALFLAKLRSALEPSHPEHHLTSLSLSVRDKEKDADTIVLRITCTLPAGLRPLKWPMFLKKAAASSLTTHLMLPLIQAQHVKAAESAKLIAELKEKDIVICKLRDKLQATGVGLENVFPSLHQKRGAARTEAEGKIKGLAKFSEADFFKDSTVNGGVLGNAQHLIEQVFGQGEGLSYSPDFESSLEAGLDDWWRTLGKDDVVSLTEKRVTIPVADTPPSHTKDQKEGNGEVDDFEVQDTPPHPRSARKKAAKGIKDTADEETASEAESPSQIPDSYPSPATTKPAPLKKGKLGTMAGKKKQATPAPKSPTPESSKDEPMGDAAADTASEPDAPPPPKPAATPKRRLGAMGGKRKKAEDEASLSKAGSEEGKDNEDAAEKTAVKVGSRLGHLGKKKAAAKDQEDGGEAGGKQAEAGKPKAKAKVEEQKPAETEQERADRRRAELQKDLTKKVAAGPVKKKRKF